MVKKSPRKRKSSKNSLKKEIQHEIKEVEDWIAARRKFLIKLAWVVGLVVALLIISHIYLRIAGAGI